MSHPVTSISEGFLRLAFAAVCLAQVAACEAPLHMDAVHLRAAMPVRPSDQFQAASANDQAIVVVGNQGLVVRSTDGGENWQRQQLTGWPELISVSSCPDGGFAALAAEGVVWLSADSGVSWNPSAIDSEEAPQAVTCDPLNRIWVVGSYSSIFWSEDAGASWDYFSLDEDLIFTNIQFVDSETAYISGEFGALMKTTDGGLNWQRLEDLEDDFYPQAMYFENAERGWLVGLQGSVLHTTDGAQSWSLQASPTRVPLYGIDRLGADTYVVGGEGTLLKLVDDQWMAVDHGMPIQLYLRVVYPLDGDRLLVAGQSGVLFVLAAGGKGMVGDGAL